MPFSQLGLPEVLQTALLKQNFQEPYPIQKEAIPAILQKKDVLGIAKTGSGKTIGYVLPVLSRIKAATILKNRHIAALVLVPTRELAMQVQEVFDTFNAFLPEKLKSLAVFGGVSINPQMIKLQGVSILVATPGRLLELIDSNALHLSDLEILVLDEADKMLNLGFKKEMEKIFHLLPKQRQNLLFSATLSKDISHIQQVLLKNPEIIKIEETTESIEIEQIEQTAYFVSHEQKGPLLRFLLKEKNWQQVLIFASSIQRADNIANKLRNNKIDAMSIHSKKSQGARTDVLTKFKYKHLRVLVATDLISRGIDIDSLPCVVNYELPRSPKDYIHRIGRTGRADQKGEAISLIAPDEEAHFKVIQKKMGKPVTLINSENIVF